MSRQKRFTAEFKEEAVRLALTAGRTQAQAARDLGIGHTTLERWIAQHRDRQMDERRGPLPGEDMAAELKRLRRENDILRQERDILKKAAAFFAREGSR